MSKAKSLKQSVAAGLMLALVSFASAPMAFASDVLTIEVKTGSYRIVNQGDEQKVEMGGFGYLTVPGKPMLPSRNFLIGILTINSNTGLSAPARDSQFYGEFGIFLRIYTNYYLT